MKNADLHTHSKYSSDGELTPQDLIKKAKEAGLKYIAITDHDSVDGVEEAIKAGKKYDVEVIPGVEIHSEYGEILGYFINLKNKELIRLCKKNKDSVNKRGLKTIRLLAKEGYVLNPKEILKKYKRTLLERPLIALGMVDKGYVKSFREAFDRFLANENKKYYVKAEFTPTQQVIKTIRLAGGVAVLAHPYYENYKAEFKNIKKLIAAGLVGMETKSGKFEPENYGPIIKEIESLAKKYNLVLTSGSDFHGSNHPQNPLGSSNCNENAVLRLKKIIRSYNNG